MKERGGKRKKRCDIFSGNVNASPDRYEAYNFFFFFFFFFFSRANGLATYKRCTVK